MYFVWTEWRTRKKKYFGVMDFYASKLRSTSKTLLRNIHSRILHVQDIGRPRNDYEQGLTSKTSKGNFIQVLSLWLLSEGQSVGTIFCAWTLFSAPRGTNLLFTSDWTPDYTILHCYWGSPILCTTSLLLSQCKPVPIYTSGSRGVS